MLTHRFDKEYLTKKLNLCHDLIISLILSCIYIFLFLYTYGKQNPSLCFSRKTVIKGMRVSKWWQKSYFFVNSPCWLNQRHILRLTLLLFVPMENQDAGCSLHTQIELLCGQPAVFVNPKDVVLHANPVDVVLKQVNSKGLRNTWNETKYDTN